MRVVAILGITLSCVLGVGAPIMQFLGPSLAYVQSCDARENPEETAVSFISRCCKGSSYREFPGQLLFVRIAEIQRGSTAAHKKAWKLLNDNRFKK